MSQVPAPAGRRRLRWWMLASLATNLILLVILISVLQRPPRVWEPVMPSPRALGRALPEVHQPMFEQILAEHRPLLRQALRERRELRRELKTMLQADPFPRAALEQRLELLRQRDGGVSAAAHALLLDTLEQLPAADRRQVVEAMVERGRGHRERRRQRERDNERPKAEAPASAPAPTESQPEASTSPSDQG